MLDEGRVMTGRKPIHGLTLTPEYRAWQGIRLRCTDPSHKAYPRYGGRGINVCERWLESVETFISDMGPKPTPARPLSPKGARSNRSPCVGCGNTCQGLRCRSCEDERKRNGTQ
jgi:hypothetical protein